MTAKKNGKFWLALIIFSLTGQIAWVVENMYFNVFLYEMFHASPADISAMVSASAIAATVTTLLVGAFSDKVGKRKVFICGGYILWGVSICAFAAIRPDVIETLFPAMAASAAAIGVTLTIVMDCVMTFFGSSANDACFNAWLTESTDHTNRGAAEGINAMMPLVAILAVFGGFMSFDLSKAESWTTIFLIIGIAVILIGVLGLFLLKESTVTSEENRSCLRNLIYSFRPSVIRENHLLYLGLLVFALFNISIQIFMPYLILYYTESLKMDNYVLIMAPAVIVASVFTAIYGRVYDKLGFTRAVLPTLGLLTGGYLLLFFFKGTALVFVGSLLMMSGYLSGAAMFGALIREHTPAGKAGMFQGVRIIGQVLVPGVIGPAIGAAVLKNAETVVNGDGTTSFIPNANIYLAALAAAIVLILALVPVCKLLKKGANCDAE
ncbi:MAG: MFS transporter [Clostridia bacterium]|nr:MFS transporter [Clostridia bacterium]